MGQLSSSSAQSIVSKHSNLGRRSNSTVSVLDICSRRYSTAALGETAERLEKREWLISWGLFLCSVLNRFRRFLRPNENPSALAFLSYPPCLCVWPFAFGLFVPVFWSLPVIFLALNGLICQDGPNLGFCSAFHPASNSDPVGTRVARRGHAELWPCRRVCGLTWSRGQIVV